MFAAACCAGCRPKGSDGAQGDSDALVDGDYPPEERSRRAIARHRDLHRGQPGLMAYSVGSEGPLAHPNDPILPGSRLPRANHITPNTPAPTPFETPFFKGTVIFMNRQRRAERAARDYPYRWHFRGRKRDWEFRIQGKFKHVPKGSLWVGFVPRDIDCSEPVSWKCQVWKNAGMALVKYRTYLSYGDRGDALGPDSELAHLVADMTAWDQIIVTPGGQTPPDTTKEISGQGLVRADLGLDRYRSEVENVLDTLNVENTYTFCFWGISRIVDTLSWKFKFGKMPAFGMNLCFEDWPLHCVMYELDPELVASSSFEQDGKHLESLKRYYIDFMFWGSPLPCSGLPAMFDFADAPVEHEEAAARANGVGTAEAAVSRSKPRLSQVPEGRTESLKDPSSRGLLQSALSGLFGPGPPPPPTPVAKRATGGGAPRMTLQEATPLTAHSWPRLAKLRGRLSCRRGRARATDSRGVAPRARSPPPPAGGRRGRL